MITGYDSTKPYKTAIKELIQKTWDNPYLEIRDGYYVQLRKKHSGFEVDHTDGIGTKGIHHWVNRTFKEAAQDVLAMNVNDLCLSGAKAYKAQVHLMLPEDDHKAVIQLMTHLSDLCCERGIAITGGETSVHSNLTGLEISLTVSGIVTEGWRAPLVARDGDCLICLPSNGVHSNGFTLINELFQGSNKAWMTAPTKLYDDLILNRRLPIHAAMHITGGAWTKVKEILPPYCSAIFNTWEIPSCFTEIYEKYLLFTDAGLFRKESVPLETMYKTFNMGVGMVLAVAPENAELVASTVGGFVGGVVRAFPPPSSFTRIKQVILSTKLSDKKVVFAW